MAADVAVREWGVGEALGEVSGELVGGGENVGLLVVAMFKREREGGKREGRSLLVWRVTFPNYYFIYVLHIRILLN